MKRSAELFLLVSISTILSLLVGTIPQVAEAAQNVLILTDNSGGAVNGDSHVSDLIAAFTNAGATVTTNSTELTNGSAMPMSLVTGWNVVIVVTVSGAQIDADDIPVLQNAVNTRASSAFLFFTDACSQCTRGSASAVLPIVNAAGGWSATLGNSDDASFVGTLTGAYSGAFAGLPSITSTAYSPLLSVPPDNVIYTTNAPSSPGPCAVVAPGTASSACVFLATDVTEFYVTGGISPTQANGLAAAYLNAATGCPLQPYYSLNVTTVGSGSVTKTPNQPSYPAGTVVQLTATPAGEFVGWSLDASGSANPLSVTMNTNKNIRATFSGTVLAEDWFNDAFPANDGSSPDPNVAVQPGTARFDTAAAYIKTGHNTAALTGVSEESKCRPDIPGDSLLIIRSGADVRVDLVFRIKPGVGNYVTTGVEASGLKKRPDLPAALTATPDNFWSSFIANPGEMSQGVHGPGLKWNRNVWNSARIDTADVNIYPVQSNPNVFDVNANFAATADWMATYHELDPRWNGAPQSWLSSHNRCFLNNPAGAANSTNISCAGIPGGAGYDPATPTTSVEGNKVIPDGLLTPGAHVEYFVRSQLADHPRDDLNFAMVPDTHYVSPQIVEGSTDGHRWQQFGVLPDRWKNGAPFSYESDVASGMACMLYVDLDDTHGDERIWVSVADSIGATAGDRRGAHNGWIARGDQLYTDPVTGNPLDVTVGDPSRAQPICAHGGQPGSKWDMFGVKGITDPVNGSAGAIGDREACQPDAHAINKGSKLGPTPEMLRTYYRGLFILSGDLDTRLFGEFPDRDQDDIVLIEDFLTNAQPSGTTPRFIYIGGNGFAASELATSSLSYPEASDHVSFLTNYLGASQRAPSYQTFCANPNPFADLSAAGPIAGVHAVGLGPSTINGNALLQVVVNSLSASASGYYENFGLYGPYVSGVYTPVNGSPGKFYESFFDGWDIQSMVTSKTTPTSLGRIGYYSTILKEFSNTVGCTLQGTPLIPLDVPNGGDRALVNFVALRNNPLRSGKATVHFGMARADRANVCIYDVGGRLVRTLVDREFPAGEHDLQWDGADDQGQRLRTGIYFTRVRYVRSGFTGARKITMLK